MTDMEAQIADLIDKNKSLSTSVEKLIAENRTLRSQLSQLGDEPLQLSSHLQPPPPVPQAVSPAVKPRKSRSSPPKDLKESQNQHKTTKRTVSLPSQQSSKSSAQQQQPAPMLVDQQAFTVESVGSGNNASAARVFSLQWRWAAFTRL